MTIKAASSPYSAHPGVEELDMEVSAPLCKQLPYEARETLARAARTPITTTDPLARLKAIDVAIERIRVKFPRLFNE